ncbi:hypothetical protein PspLS_11213 [Pyricularia sp. CBS 133598]|nr:hypothetical protein PspLS_11213 [Pyricularia sp. CBS 133598]
MPGPGLCRDWSGGKDSGFRSDRDVAAMVDVITAQSHPHHGGVGEPGLGRMLKIATTQRRCYSTMKTNKPGTS